MHKKIVLILGADSDNLRIILKHKKINERIIKGNARDRAELKLISDFLKTNMIDFSEVTDLGVLVHDFNRTSVRVIKVIAATIAWYNKLKITEIKTNDLFALSKQNILAKF